MGRLKAFLNAWGPALIWMALIFYLSAQSQLPTAPESWLDTLLKKSAHFLVYAVLARLYLRALGFYRSLPVPAAGYRWQGRTHRPRSGSGSRHGSRR